MGNPRMSRVGCIISIMLSVLLSTSFKCSLAATPKIAHKEKAMTTSEVIQTYGPAVRKKLKVDFEKVDVAYPPKRMTWIGLKQEKMLYCFAPDSKGMMRKVLSLPIVGTSGASGPKLKQGDLQIPEGLYALTGFRPHVIAHIGLDVNYPNAEDKAHAKKERRTNLGGDIMIHGHYISTGCLAMTDEPIETLFVLAYDTGLKNVKLILAPCNLAKQKADVDFMKQPVWLPELYERIGKALRGYAI